MTKKQSRKQAGKQDRGQRVAIEKKRIDQENYKPFPWNRFALLGLMIVFGLSLIVNSIGLSWGQPGGNPWHSDSIAGTKTVNEMPRLFGQWKNKYPRVHFLVNGIFYKPLLDRWKKDPIMINQGPGRSPKVMVLDIERSSTLIMVSRWISVFMGAASVAAIFLTARILFRNDRAAFFAGITLALSQIFVFYSHLGNTDIPSAFWFAWSIYWGVKAVYIGKWRHYVLLGFFCSLAICTKDPVGGYVVGLGLAVWLGLVGKARQEGQPFSKAIGTILSWKIVVAVVVSAFVFALMNDMFTGLTPFKERMSIWFGRVDSSGYKASFRGHGWLLRSGYHHLYYSIGWPLLIVLGVSLIYNLIRIRWKWVFGLLPFVLFYLIIIMRSRLLYPRFFMPALPAFALLAGVALADWFRWKKLPFLVRLIPIIVVYGLSLLYCIGIDLEMIHDSRHEAEQWFVDHVDRKTHVAVISPVTYAPRLHLEGFPVSFRWTRNTNEDVLRKNPPYPKYIVMCEKWYTDTKYFDQNFRKAIFDGSLGYEEVVSFDNMYLYPKKTIFGLAGWPRKKLGLLSPEIHVFERE